MSVPPASWVAPSVPNGEVPVPNAKDVAIAAAADARLPQVAPAGARTTRTASSTPATSMVTATAVAPAPASAISRTASIGRSAPAPAVHARMPVVATASRASAGTPYTRRITVTDDGPASSPGSTGPSGTDAVSRARPPR